ncbi:MAG TPA: GntR family transcriptional regulator [Rhizobium sp.]
MKGRSGADANRLSELTYDHILSLIEAGELRSGAILEERALATRLSVSRTPVRAALSRLVGEGLVDRTPNGFLTVTELGLQDFAQLIQSLRIVEDEAAYLAVGKVPEGKLRDLIERIELAVAQKSQDAAEHWRLDDELHALVARSCANRWLEQSVLTVPGCCACAMSKSFLSVSAKRASNT